MKWLDRSALLFLHQLPDIGWETIHSIYKEFTGFREIEELEGDKLHQRTGISLKRAHLICSRLKDPAYGQLHESYIKKGVGTLTILDDEYPDLLKRIARPPWVMYYRGDLSAFKHPMISIVGTRLPTTYGKTVAQGLSKQMAAHGWTVVSGLARGIDSDAHLGALAIEEGKTIAVLGAGLYHIYPKENLALSKRIVQSGGILLSEVTPETTPKAGLFPLRNRIIAGLSHGTVVVEASHKSGSLITADLAIQESREVFAVPGPITSPKSAGPLELISQGAKLVRSEEDILDEFLWFQADRLKAAQKGNDSLPKLDLSEQKLLNALSMEPLHFDQLLSIGIFSLAELHTLLISLQMKKIIKQLPGSNYVRIDGMNKKRLDT
jgi:DNA processing protein